jgi:transposase-like protein
MKPWRIVKLHEIRSSLDAGLKDEIILLCLRWYFRFKLSYRVITENTIRPHPW